MGQCYGKTIIEPSSSSSSGGSHHSPPPYSHENDGVNITLPPELLQEILLRLPPSTLMTLTSVCKAWYSIIKSHSFISSHLQRSFSNNNNTPFILIRRFSFSFSPTATQSQWLLSNSSSSRRMLAKLEPPPFSSPLRFVDSLHGLLCLVQETSTMRHHSIILWNPSIRRHLAIRVPSATHLALGFGFDSVTNDYKVIRIIIADKNNPLRVELYSLNSCSWRFLDAQGIGTLLRFSQSPCFLSGNVHWIAESQNNVLVLLMFNVEEHEFRKMELPFELVNVWFSHLKVTVIEGCLSLLHYCGVTGFNRWCNVWMMREYGVAESWTKTCKLSVQGGRISHVFGLRSTSVKLLVMQQNQAEMHSEFVSLHSFDPMSEEITDFEIRGDAITACEYTGSLALLDKSIAIDY